ncbi:MAG: SIMPL domain-containing protein [Betaproteobacteria bacterium]|nr:SIMPL domain-containing protein [Betaproteobacteria bacterium]
MRTFFAIALTFLGLFSLPVSAQTANTPTIVELTAEATLSASNDQGRATLFVEGSDQSLPNLSHKLNQQTASALTLAKAYEKTVKTRTGTSQSWPIYVRNSTRIESWRMRSEIVLESRDTAALSELIGKLQNSGLALANIGFQPAPETRKKVEDAAIVDAIAAFHARAEVAANALGHKYRIRQIAIHTQNQIMPRPLQAPMARTAAASLAESSPAPVEAGESQINVNISGQIELQ